MRRPSSKWARRVLRRFVRLYTERVKRAGGTCHARNKQQRKLERWEQRRAREV